MVVDEAWVVVDEACVVEEAWVVVDEACVVPPGVQTGVGATRVGAGVSLAAASPVIFEYLNTTCPSMSWLATAYVPVLDGT